MMKQILFSAVVLFSPLAHAQEQPLERVASQMLIEQFDNPLGIADVAAARPMTLLALDLVKHFELWMPEAYNDPAGYCTIGYGHLIALRNCEQTQLGRFQRGLTEPEGAALLDEDSLGARLAVGEMVSVTLTDEQFSALSSFVFNVGKENFSTSTLLRLLNDGQYELAGAEFRRWVRARGQVLRGLEIRRACEEALYLGRLQYDANGRFDRSACITLGVADAPGPLIDIESGEQ